MSKLYWNCPAHQTHAMGCPDCESITEEMQPEYCSRKLGTGEGSHEFVDGKCRCGYREVTEKVSLVCASCGDSTKSVKYRLREDKNLCAACFMEHSPSEK
jgi:hypothetical protein